MFLAYSRVRCTQYDNRRMPLASAGELVAAARAAGDPVLAFNVVGLEHAAGVVAGAEAADAAVILQVSENTVRFHGGLAPLAAAAAALARGAAVPVGLHLDHATSAQLVDEGLSLGFGSVMFDAGALDYDANVAATAIVVARCHEAGAWVEGELGEIGGKGGAAPTQERTDPAEAAAYVAATGVDALAVAVGSSHQMLDRVARLDFPLIRRLREALPVPLVLHGSSGVPDADIVEAIACGITKVNVATLLNARFTQAARAALAADERLVDPRGFLGPGRDAIAREVARLLPLLRTSDVTA
jgi:fructose-bisphosphate aldolase class II